jgi:hypothetical protein
LPKIVLGKSALTEGFIPNIRKFKIVDYDKIGSIFLSPNAQYSAIVYKKDDKYYIQINDKTYGLYNYDDFKDPPIF